MIRYAKIVENELQYSPNPIRADDKDIFTTNPTAYGFKPIVHTEPQAIDGMKPVFDGWIENETEITQSWRYEPIVTEDDAEATSEEYENALGKFGV